MTLLIGLLLLFGLGVWLLQQQSYKKAKKYIPVPIEDDLPLIPRRRK